MSASAETLPYSPSYIKIWTTVAVVLGLFLLSMFIFGSCYLAAGQCVWDFIRKLATPII